MDRDRALPEDFGRRVAAARGYASGISRAELAARLNVTGASASSIKSWERGGHKPGDLAWTELVKRLASVTGLPEAFFWNDSPAEPSTSIEQDIAAIREQLDTLLSLVQKETAANRTMLDKTAASIEVLTATTRSGTGGRPQRTPGEPPKLADPESASG